MRRHRNAGDVLGATCTLNLFIYFVVVCLALPDVPGPPGPSPNTMSGLPSHKLRLHVGCPIILMRNMSGGLANGTRMIVTRLMRNVIQAKVATGPAKDTYVWIPRLNITPSDESMPFVLCRRQFPIKPAYAMTINKAQGQTLKAAGVYLPKPVFGHGQLYVAFSRVGIWDALKVLVVGGFKAATATLAAGMYTSNVVFKEVFQGVSASAPAQV